MLLFKVTFLLVVLATAVHCKPRKKADHDINLVWPKKYSFQINIYHIESGVAEDLAMWKANGKLRVEYNRGAVKIFAIGGFFYKIHPETYGEDYVNKIVCNFTTLAEVSDNYILVLPNATGFKYVDDEQMNSQNCSKFYKEWSSDNGIDTKETIWAYYDKKADAFVPVRYEKKEFIARLGPLQTHNLWEIEGYDADFNEQEIFNISKYKDCFKQDPISHEMHDEAVTKHLLHIDPEDDDHVNHVFEAFKTKFDKNYAHEDEHTMRRSIFQQNLRLIKSTNSKNLSYKLAVNKFSDRTPEEMKRVMGLKRRPEGKKGLPFPYDDKQLSSEYNKLPQEYDLRLEGVISPVQNQESCGSCWTFGATSAVEGAIARSNGGNLIRLSNQALIDCAWEFGAVGCSGGTDNEAYEWIKKYGMPKISEYGTYADQEGYCMIHNMTETYKIKGFVDVTPNSVQALKVALVNHGPLSVSVHASKRFQLYEGGVFYDLNCNSTDLDHEITLIGYAEEFGETFWIVKNSWGQDWGIDGFMHILAKDNNCGIMTEPTYVLV